MALNTAVLTPADLSRLMPSSPGLAAHCRRVSALAAEIAARLSLSAESATRLEQAALLHHSLLLRGKGLERLAADLGLRVPEGPDETLPAGVAEILEAARFRRKSTSRRARVLAEILEVSNVADEEIELRALDPAAGELSKVFDDLEGLIGRPVLRAARSALDSPFRAPAGIGESLAVHASAARKVLRGLSSAEPGDTDALASLAKLDPTLAASVVRVANSALYANRQPVRSVQQAVSYIGFDAGRKILMALALKPLFGPGAQAGAWRHAAWMADLCERVATLTGFLPADEAFLLGLVHDIGGLAIQTLPRAPVETVARLKARGCPSTYAERLALGEDHADIGSRVIEEWSFPPEAVTAVRFHHRPADCESRGASMLYLAEYWAASEEDLPSARHLCAALAATGWTADTFRRAESVTSVAGELLRAA